MAPAGPQGIQGIQGEKGDKGDKGVTTAAVADFQTMADNISKADTGKKVIQLTTVNLDASYGSSDFSSNGTLNKSINVSNYYNGSLSGITASMLILIHILNKNGEILDGPVHIVLESLTVMEHSILLTALDITPVQDMQNVVVLAVSLYIL